tara:strand:+ start:4432 stop:5115 length:684 start_codon:yes stop_codon:yes gene_type:complete
MKGYIEHKVKQTSVWSTNVLENGAFSEDDIKKSLEDIFKLKNFIDPDRNSHNINISPGIQYMLNYSFSDTVDQMLLYCKKETTNTYLHNRTNKSFHSHLINNWVYIAYSNEPNQFWHHHENLKIEVPEPVTGKERRIPFRGDFTYVLYLSLPDNMEEKGGLIHFTTKDWDKDTMNDESLIEYTYKPKVGDLIIFPAWLNHMPEQSTDPTTRVILGGNAHFRKNVSLI